MNAKELGAGTIGSRLRRMVFADASNRGHDVGLLVLRVASGFLIAARHGLPKLMRAEELIQSFGDPIGLGSGPTAILAIFAEFVCAVLVMVGAATRLATVPLIAAMSVAASIVHGSDPFARKELALVYLIAFVAILILGGGSHSVDGLVRRHFSARSRGTSASDNPVG